jgi:putative phosphoesterase
MKIAILSDTHSRYATVGRALDLARERGIAKIIHCGDIEDGMTVRLFAEFETHFVYGNCDYDREGLAATMTETGATLHGTWGCLELGNRKLAWAHGDDKRLLRDLEQSGQFDYLFYGHTHVAEQHQSGSTLMINPGALHRTTVKQFVVLDLGCMQLQTVVVE